MLLLYIKFTIIIIFVAIVFKFLTKIITFNTSDYHIKKPVESGKLSLIIISILLVITIIYLLIIKEYFINVSPKVVNIYHLMFNLLQVLIILAVIIYRKEDISSIGITKKNIIKSLIIGTIIGITYYILVKNIFEVNKLMDVMSKESCNSFINMLVVVGFGEEIISRGYLQTRLISWLGTMKGIFATAVIFSFSHLPQRVILGGLDFNSALVNCAFLIPVSLLMGYIFTKTKNIVTSSIFHTFVDWTEFVISIVV